MIIQILEQPIIRVNCDAVFLYLYSDVRPPKGATGTVDWYMCGFISRLIKAGKISGQFQDVVMLATQNRIAARKALLLGMGPTVDMQADKVFSVWKQAALTMCDVDIFQLVTTVPFNEKWNWDVGDAVSGMLQGLIQGIEAAGKNIREFRLYITNFNDLKTKKNKEQVRKSLKSVKQVSLIGF